MEIKISQEQCRVPVSVVAPTGDLDRATYQQLLATAQSLYAQGTRHVLLDLSQVPYISSAGLMALHSMALMLEGQALPDAEDGWGAMQRMRESEAGPQEHVKLLNPQPKVSRVLQTSGLDAFFPTFTDRQAALASF